MQQKRNDEKTQLIGDLFKKRVGALKEKKVAQIINEKPI